MKRIYNLGGKESDEKNSKVSMEDSSDFLGTQVRFSRGLVSKSLTLPSLLIRIKV